MSSGEKGALTDLDDRLSDNVKLEYGAPEFQAQRLSAIVLSGATGGGDSGFTGLRDDGPSEEDGLEEEDFYFG